MQQSRKAYYAFFAIYPPLIGGLAAITLWLDEPALRRAWVTACVLSLAAWTLLEYLLHRFVFHGRSVFAAMHDAHHVTPRAYIGTPTWLTLCIVAGLVFLPAWLAGSFNTASGITTGVMTGYYWYSLVHHALHYSEPRRLAAGLRGLGLGHHHAVHHYAARGGNYGVSTVLWDHVFGTALPADAPAARRGH